MTPPNDVAGHAALAICEALLLCLSDRKILPESEVMGIMKDAAESHAQAPETDPDNQRHKAVAKLINAIIAGGNSVRHP
jgi:hypothetical protein